VAGVRYQREDARVAGLLAPGAPPLREPGRPAAVVLRRLDRTRRLRHVPVAALELERAGNPDAARGEHEKDGARGEQGPANAADYPRLTCGRGFPTVRLPDGGWSNL